MITRKLICCFALIGMVIPAGYGFTAHAADKKTEEPEANQESTSQSKAFKGKKDWKALKSLSEEELKVFIESPVEWRNFGIACSNLQDINCAIRVYSWFASIRTESEVVWSRLGSLYRQAGQPGNALKAYQKALGVNKNSVRNWNHLGFVHNELRQYKHAIQAYQAALSIDPKYANAWFNLGIAYNNMRQYDKAISAFNEATKSENMGAVWSHVGYSYLALKRYADAINSYEAAVQVAPDDSDAWYNLGIAYAQVGRADMAMRTYLSIKKRKPKLAGNFYRKIIVPLRGLQ